MMKKFWVSVKFCLLQLCNKVIVEILYLYIFIYFYIFFIFLFIVQVINNLITYIFNKIQGITLFIIILKIYNITFTDKNIFVSFSLKTRDCYKNYLLYIFIYNKYYR